MSNSNVVRTMLAGNVQTCQYIKKPVVPIPNTTLNQKLDIATSVAPSDQDVMGTNLVVIGNGGHSFQVGANGRVKWQGLNHEPTHFALYNQLPFVLRLPTEDLTPTERQRYRLRCMRNYGGQDYVAYYARVMDLSNVAVELELRHVENGNTSSKPFVPTIENLNPVPPKLSTGQVLTTTGDYGASSAKIPAPMSASDVAEFTNACRIIHGEDGWNIISEMAVVASVDRNVTATIGGNQQTYVEAINAVIMAHIVSAWVMDYQTDGVTMTIDAGSVEPLLTLTPA